VKANYTTLTRNLSYLTHSSYSAHTPGAVGSHLLRQPGSDWGLGALFKDTSVVGIENRRECGFENWSRNLMDYKSNSL